MRNIFFIFIITFCSSIANSQDTLQKVVLVDFYQSSPSIKSKDTLQNFTKLALPNSSIADVLARENGVFIKNYGPGNIATITHKGLSASHTSVLWNGLNIQNNTLSTIDFSIIPLMGFEKSSWQSGAINNSSANPSAGGAFILSSLDASDNHIQVILDGGSFLNFGQAAKIKYAKKNHHFQFSAHNRYTKNNFPIINFKELGLFEKNRQNAQILNNGAQVDYAYYFKNHHKIQASAWYGSAKRQVPAPLYTSEINAIQKDRFIRSLISYNFNKGRHELFIKQAFFAEELVYTDNNLPEISYMSFINWMSDVQYYLRISPRFQASFNAQYSHTIGKNTTYFKRENSIYTTFSFLYQNNKNTDLRIFIKPQFINSKYLTVIPQLFAGFHLPKGFQISTEVSRIFRAPSMNDRYWSQGGNPNLLPEKGYSADINIKYIFKKTKAQIGTFGNLLKDRIVWSPENSFWTPQNIDNTYALGLESKMTQRIDFKKHSLNFLIQYTYTYTQLLRPQSANLNKKKLIYTPEHIGSITLEYAWKNLFIAYSQRLTSKRYTTFDNSISLPLYTTADFTANYTLNTKPMSIRFFGTIQNLFNQYYEVVALRPMPGIHFQTGINLKIHIKK